MFESAVFESLAELPFVMLALFAFVTGTCVGSFLNVVIHRLPRGESIVHPRSRCPHCGWSIPGWANVPLVSYAVLRGRCKGCSEPISARYPAVELLVGLLFVAVIFLRPAGARMFLDAGLVAALVAVSFIDWDHQIIPNSITLPGIPLGLAASFVWPPPIWLDALLAIVIAGGMMWGLSALYEWRTGRVGLGMGDVKLVAMLGAFLGLQPALGVMVLGSILGLVHGVVMIALGGGGRLTRIPFGPALAVAGIAHVLAPGLLNGVFGAV